MSIQRTLSNINFGLLTLLIFIVVFQDRLSVPTWLQPAGRAHILLLHLPIGMIILVAILIISLRTHHSMLITELFKKALLIITFFTLLTALAGLLLSREDGYDVGALSMHKNWGIATAILVYLASWAYGSKSLFPWVGLVSMVTLIVGSHFGANMTHGEGFLIQPLKSSAEMGFDENNSLFSQSIQPILKSKCYSCHNPDKKKGELDLTDTSLIEKGGKNGPIIDRGQVSNSTILKSIYLPLLDKKHMPPDGKTQLTSDEIQLLHRWIQDGAQYSKTWKSYAANDSLLILSKKYIVSVAPPVYNFPAASPAVVQSLNDPYCVIKPLHENSPALRADFFVRAQYNKNKLVDLQKVKDQLTELNLGNMPVANNELQNLLPFVHLEKLILNNSAINDSAAVYLVQLPALKTLALSGTSITKEIMTVLNQSKSIREVFAWNTSLSTHDVDSSTTIDYFTGLTSDSTEVQRLNAPAILNENTILGADEYIELYHRVKGVDIRYTLDGTEPDSFSSTIYTKPIPFNLTATVKTLATKAGWLTSPVTSFSFHKKGITPIKANLLTTTDPKYKAEGSASLIDLVKGSPRNLIEGTWLGYREHPAELEFEFDGTNSISTLVISYNNNIPSYLFPPYSVEVYSKDEFGKSTLIKKVQLPAVTEKDKNLVNNASFLLNVSPAPYKYLRININNLPKIPQWHGGKGQKGWLFLDELFFY